MEKKKMGFCPYFDISDQNKGYFGKMAPKTLYKNAKASIMISNFSQKWGIFNPDFCAILHIFSKRSNPTKP